MSRRESRPAATAPLATSNILSSPPVIESPLFDQVREEIYSEVATLVSENESRPNYVMELLRVAQLLNTDYLRQTGLNSLKRVINDYLNPVQIDPQAFSSFPAPPLPPLPSTILPDTQLVQEADVYSPSQNFPRRTSQCSGSVVRPPLVPAVCLGGGGRGEAGKLEKV